MNLNQSPLGGRQHDVLAITSRLDLTSKPCLFQISERELLISYIMLTNYNHDIIRIGCHPIKLDKEF
jgi:hypothetical protein